MANARRPGINVESKQNVVDGTMCLAESPKPGPIGMVPPALPPILGQDAMTLAKQVDLDPKGRPVTLFFGIGKNETKIPANMATLPRILTRTTEGRTLLKMLVNQSWILSERVWWELSDRVSKLAGNSDKPVHVYVSMAYHDRVFPNPGKLKNWWANYKNELIANKKKDTQAKKMPGALLSSQMDSYRKKLDNWSQEDIEAQYYAIKGKNRYSGNYEDEIFHKIERLNIVDVNFHALDDATGREVKSWIYTLSG